MPAEKAPAEDKSISIPGFAIALIIVAAAAGNMFGARRLMNHTMIASKRHAASEQEHKLAKEVQKRAESIFSGGAERSEEAFHRARSTAQKSAEHSEDFFRRASCLAPDKLDPFRKELRRENQLRNVREKLNERYKNGRGRNPTH